jgi:hypothetical protein
MILARKVNEMTDEFELRNQEELEKFEVHISEFYSMIGLCITRFQTVNDYIADIFHAALGGSNEKADGIFQVARGLESQLALVTACMADRSSPLRELWSDLRPRIKFAADNRNQIAHAKSHHNGPTVVLKRDDERDRFVLVDVQYEKQRMELRKKHKVGESVWSLLELREEKSRLDEIFAHQIIIKGFLAGEPPRPSLAKRWDHPAVDKCMNQ